MKMLPSERPQRRLEVVNSVILPLLRAAGRQRKLQRILGKEAANPTAIYQTNDYTVTVLVYTLPAGNPLVVAIYASTQVSRPLSPQQLAQRLKRLKTILSKLRGRLFNQADIVFLLHAPAGLTRGAIRIAVENGVSVSKTPLDAARSLARFLATRYRRLSQKLYGRRIWGPIPLLLYMLAYLASQLDASVEPPSLSRIVELASRGGIYS